MSAPKFMPGESYIVEGVEFHLAQGRKHADDIRCDIYVPRAVALSMKVAYFMADFYAHNERVLYPHRCDQAGERFIIACRGAQTLGWEWAAAQLDDERAAAKARRVA